MIWWSQLVLLLSMVSVYMLMLRCYRRQDAMEESYLCSILLCLAGCLVPEAVLLVPFFWWGFHMIWANNLRVYMASVLGILSVALYAAIAAFMWPESVVVRFVEQQWIDAFSRQFCSAMPLWYILSGSIVGGLGLWYLAAHLIKFARANVRIQTRALLMLPVVLISILSFLFPAQSGNSLLVILYVSSIYLMVLHLVTYGLPKIHLPKRKERRGKMNRRRASYSRPSAFSKMLANIRGRRERRKMRGRSTYGRPSFWKRLFHRNSY